jgi:hypothetical protein
MATYTAAAGGGNWNVAATWGGAGIPISGDTAILNAASGQVTVTANAACLVLNCTGYLNTLTINTGFQINVFGTGATISLGGTISTLQQGVISTVNTLITSAAITINFNGVIIPRLTLGYNSGAGTQTVTINGTTPTVQNLMVTNGVSGGTLLANTTLNISSTLIVSNGNGLGGIPFNFSGTACTVVTNATISGGFNVLNGCTLSLSGPLRLYNGVYTFNLGSALIHNNQTLILSPNVGCTLNTSLVTWYNINDTAARTTLTSDLNISGNLTIANAGGFFAGSGGVRNINIGGNLSVTFGGNINTSNTIINLNGSGIWDGIAGSGFRSTTININTSGYTIGSATRNGLSLFQCTINLVGLNSCTVNTGHTLSIGATAAPNLSTLNTNNTGTGGSQIIWENLSFATNTQIVLSNETTFAKNVTGGGTGFAAITGAKLFLGGNLTSPSGQTISGSSTIEFYGSNTANWNTTAVTAGYANPIIINKVGGTLNLLGTISYGGVSLTRINGTILPGSSTVSIPNNTSSTISGMTFWDLTIPGTGTLTQNVLNTIENNLTLGTNGSVTFAGTAGWICANLICTAANRIIQLQHSVSYRTTTQVSITGGTFAVRNIMRSSLTGTDAIWTLDFGATQSLIYVNSTDIDSSGGQTVWSFGVSAANVSTSINWNPGVPLRTVAYTFVN